MAKKDETQTDETNGPELAGAQPGGDSGQPQEGGNTEHQDGAPEDLVEAVEEAEDQGFIGTGAPEKADYSQANPDVMNGGS